MLSLKNTIEKIRQDQTPFWKLSYFGQGYNNIIPYAEFKEDAIDRSAHMLDSNVNAFNNPNAMRFVIETKNVSKESYKFRWEFSISGEVFSNNQHAASNETTSGLGYVQQSMNEMRSREDKLQDMRDDLSRRENALLLGQMKLSWDKENFEKDIRLKQEQINELEKKFGSNTEAFYVAANRLLGNIIEHVGAQNAVNGLLGLGSTNTTEQSQQQPAPTPEYALIETIAQELFNCNLTVQQLNIIQKYLFEFVNKIKNNVTVSQATDTTTTEQ